MEINEKTTRREWYQIGYKDGKRETAKEIFNKLYNYLPSREKTNVEIKKSSLEDVKKVVLQMYKCLKDDIRELAKEYGLEVISEKNQN